MEEADFMCEECGAEFTILADTEEQVAFCPYCGSELEYDGDEEFEEEYEYDEEDEEEE